MNNVICFLTKNPSELFYNFCKKLVIPNYKVFICIDDNTYIIPNYDNIIPIIQINNEICENVGFKNSVSYFKNKACSREKALYYFCKNSIDFDYVWFIEEDVFIPDVNTILNIDKKYLTGDLLCAQDKLMNDVLSKTWYHWNWVKSDCMLELPYYFSMVCAIRCSKKLLKEIENYANTYGRLFFCEVMFNTLSHKINLEIIKPDELSTIVYRHNWGKKDILKTNLYHPVKSIEKQYEFRA